MHSKAWVAPSINRLRFQTVPVQSDALSINVTTTTLIPSSTQAKGKVGQYFAFKLLGSLVGGVTMVVRAHLLSFGREREMN